MERTFVNAKRETLQRYLNKAVKTVDGTRNTARLLYRCQLPDWRSNREKSGIFRWDGGSVASAYKYTAYSSVLELAYWVSPRGDRHVRIKAARIQVCNNKVPKLIWGESWAAVYPNRAYKLADLRQKRAKRIIENRGISGDDDRFLMMQYHISALSKEGVLICDDMSRPRAAQVIVTCPSTGHRHHIGVAPKFVNPKSKTYQNLGSEAARVHAAIAWTFDLKPEEYNLAIAS